MTTRAVLLLAVMGLMLAGCPQRTSEPVGELRLSQEDSPAEIVVASAKLARDGKTDEALALVEQAQRRNPESGALAAQRVRLLTPLDPATQALEDQLLLDEARYLKAKVAHLSTWLDAEPGDAVASARLTYWSGQLTDRLEGLAACAERNIQARPKLSRQCLSTARSLPGSSPYSARLAAVEQQLSAQRQVVRQRRKARQVRQQRDQIAGILQSAKTLLAGGAYGAARGLLQHASAIDAENTEIADLMLEAELGLDRQVTSLLALGDRLYLDEQIDAALANWEEALSLRPEDEEIIARIDRARAVLGRLESLRNEQLPR